MTNLIKAPMKIAAMFLTAVGLLMPCGVVAQSLNLKSQGYDAHIMPPPGSAAHLNHLANSASAGGGFGPVTGALTYHGGPIMQTANTYAIFWVPPTLQSGAAASMTAHYQNVQTGLLSLYPGHGIDNNNTQYYSSSRVGFFFWTSYIENAGSFAGSYVDTSAFPAPGCADWLTPGNCLSDAQIQAEVQKVMTLKGWTGGLNNMFFVYTPSGMGSCQGPYCAYSDYCAYHGYFSSGGTTVIYANMPYADASACQLPGAGSPNGDSAADAEASVTSHELTEAITDPELNAWTDAFGSEIGDLCAWNYGTNTWDSNQANQFWPWPSYGPFIIDRPSYFELQQEYDNHTASCVQVGP